MMALTIARYDYRANSGDRNQLIHLSAALKESLGESPAKRGEPVAKEATKPASKPKRAAAAAQTVKSPLASGPEERASLWRK
jgi:hypothetical protein